jgi:hypothetical protein
MNPLHPILTTHLKKMWKSGTLYTIQVARGLSEASHAGFIRPTIFDGN